MSRNIVFEGWLTKSPPSKRIWRTKWRRRWFALRQSGELPGQYFLDYYADRNCRRLKGTINLDLCEQVDAGLHMERAGNGALDPKLRGSVFTIQTQSRTYHLEADCEAEMEKWVDAICRVCGLRSTEETDAIETYQYSRSAVSATNEHYECADTTGPYIPISECITGVRARDQNRAFTFDPGNIVVSSQKGTCDKATETRGHVYTTQPHIRITNAEFSDNESNISEDDCKSLNASQTNIPDWSVTKTFTKLAIAKNKNCLAEDSSVGPPVPPRPPKTFAGARDVLQKEIFSGPKIEVPTEVQTVQESIANYTGPGTPWLRVPRRMSHGAAPHSPGRLFTIATRYSDDEDENMPGHQTLHYCNLPSLPPAVDRALKPRYSSHSIGHINHYAQIWPPTYSGTPMTPIKEEEVSVFESKSYAAQDEIKQESLQYLDLDLHTSKPPTSRNSDRPRRFDITHGKSMSAVEADSAYKTVDFLKTEAFNITRQDAEASRSHQY